MTAQLSRERLEEIVNAAGLEPCDADEVFDSIKCWELVKMARMLLAGMDREPVGYRYRFVSARGVAAKWTFVETLEEANPSLFYEVQQVYAAPPAQVAEPKKSNTDYFDTLALDTAREIMFDVNRSADFLGGDIQLLSRIQCRIDDACRAAMLKAGTVTGWIKCSESMPEEVSEQRVCAFTPSPHVDVRFRLVPAAMFKQVCRDATHWKYMAAPEQEV